MKRSSKTEILAATTALLIVSVARPSGADAPPAHAAASAPSTPPKSWIEQGVRLFREHQYEAAKDAFSHAYELDPQTETLLDLALAELETDRPVEASKHLRDYLGRPDAPAAKLDVVRTKWLPRAEARTARLEVFAHAGADVRVDGTAAESAPRGPGDDETNGSPVASLIVAAGEHEVSARVGTFVETQHVVALGGQRVELHFQRVPDAPAVPLAKADTASNRASAEPRENPSAPSRAKWIAAVGLGSAAVVLAGIAVGFSIATEQNESDARNLAARVRAETGGDSGCLPPSPAPQCGQASQDRQAEDRNAALANGFYIAAGTAAVLAGATVLFWPSSPRASTGSLRPVPLIGDRTAGFSLSGAW